MPARTDARRLKPTEDGQARGGRGSGSGDRPTNMGVRGDQGVWLASIAGCRKAPAARDGATLAQAGTQVVVDAGQGTLPQFSQWSQDGAPIALCSVRGKLGDDAAATTVMKPPARTARQPRRAARARKRFMVHKSIALLRGGQS